MTEDEYVQADRHYRAFAKSAAKASEARAALPAGSSRARVTTANARWARAAEARDARERLLRQQWRDQQGLPQCEATDNGARCVYGAGHRVDQHSDGDRRWKSVPLPRNGKEDQQDG